MIYYCDADLRVINGGGKVFIEHVYFLNRHGLDAKLVLSHPVNWWFYDVTPFTIYRPDFLHQLDRKKDIIVFTGPWAYPWTTLLADSCVYLIQGFRDKVFYPRDPYYRQDQMIIKNGAIHKIAVSKSISDYHLETNGVSIPVLNNGIMLDQYLSAPRKTAGKVFCHARKGTETAGIFKAHFHLHELSRRFELCYAERGTFLSLHETIQTYQETKYFLDFSPLDGFALMPLEAMASGCIVFCLKNGGNREYLRNGVNGFCYEKDQPNLIPNVLSRIVELENDESFCERVRANALATAQTFDWESRIMPYVDFYGKLH